MMGPWAPMTGWSFSIYLMVCNFYGFVFPMIKIMQRQLPPLSPPILGLMLSLWVAAEMVTRACPLLRPELQGGLVGWHSHEAP